MSHRPASADTAPKRIHFVSLGCPKARAVIETGAAAHAHAFGHGDLHAADMGAAPQRFENAVAKAQHHQVLHRFLAQAVVDAEDLLLLEIPAHVDAELARGGQVVAQRLFQHPACALVDQAGAVQVRADAHEQGRRGGQVVHAIGPRLHGRGQRGEILCPGGVDAGELQPVEEAGPDAVVEVLLLDEAGHLLADEGEESFAVPGLAAQGVDAGGGRQVVVQVRHVQRGQQLAHREVAHATEDDEVQRGGGGGRGSGHGFTRLPPRCNRTK